MKQLKPFFKAALRNDGTLEMLVYEAIGKDLDGSGVTAADIKQQMDDAGPYSKIVMRINSPGGDVFEGVAIYNLLRSQGKPIEVCIDGVAASAASIIAMAGDEITMGINALVMIHDAWTVCIGNAADMRKMADTLDKVSDAIADTYVKRTGKTADEVKAMMDAETWMNAKDCMENGFATKVADEDTEESAQALALARSFKTLKNLKAVPAQLQNSDDEMCACQCDSCIQGDCKDCSNELCDDPNCTDCPMQRANAKTETAPEDTNTSLYEARLRLLTILSK